MEVTVTISGINTSGELACKQITIWAKEKTPEIDVIKSALEEMEHYGDGFHKIFSIVLS